MPAPARLNVMVIKDVTVVTFRDSSVIDSNQIEAIRDDLVDMVEKEFKNRMILDFTKVHHFSSMALGMLIPLGDKIRSAKGQLVLCGLRPEIRQVFKITKLEKKFTFCADGKAALEALNVRPE